MNTATKISMPNRAYQEIKRRILENEFSPNSILLEQELAELLEMSRTPVREALIRLSNEGMVEVRPRHGMRVLPLSAQDMREIYDILTALESQAAGIVAQSGLSKEQLDNLNQSLNDMDEALEIDDLMRWALADESFHRQLVEYSANDRLISIVNNFWDQSHRARILTLHLRQKPTKSNDDHRRVVAAIEARDSETASKEHREHRTRSGAMLVELLENNGIATV